MKSISVGELRQNPTTVLDAVEQGETYVITRHRREIGRIVPVARFAPATPAQFFEAVLSTPLDDDSWARDLRRGSDDDPADPWQSAP